MLRLPLYKKQDPLPRALRLFPKIPHPLRLPGISVQPSPGASSAAYFFVHLYLLIDLIRVELVLPFARLFYLLP